MQRTFQIPIYKSNLTIVVADFTTANTAARAHRLAVPLDSDTTVRGLTWEDPYKNPPRKGGSVGRWVILLRPDADIGIIAHESTHAAVFCLAWHEVRFGRGNDENLAYLVGWVTETVVSVIQEERQLRRARSR